MDATGSTVGDLMRMLSYWSPDTPVRVVLLDEIEVGNPPHYEATPDMLAFEITAGHYDDISTLYLILE